MSPFTVISSARGEDGASSSSVGVPDMMFREPVNGLELGEADHRMP